MNFCKPYEPALANESFLFIDFDFGQSSFLVGTNAEHAPHHALVFEDYVARSAVIDTIF